MHGIYTADHAVSLARSPRVAVTHRRYPFTESDQISVNAWSHAARTDTSRKSRSPRLLEDCFAHHPTVYVRVYPAAPRRRMGYNCAMGKRRITPDFTATKPLKRSRGGPWLSRGEQAAPATLLARQAYSTAQALRRELGRDPNAHELGQRLGIGIADARKLADELAALPRLTAGMERCLLAVAALESANPGQCPSTREVSREMGLSASAARFHIAKLVAVGLVTPPEVRLVLAVTPWGRELLPAMRQRARLDAPRGEPIETPKTPRKTRPVSSTTAPRSGKTASNRGAR